MDVSAQSRREMPRVYPLDAKCSAPVWEVGGKGAGLLKLSGIGGLKVPEGIVLTTRNYLDFVEANNLEGPIGAFGARLDELAGKASNSGTVALPRGVEAQRLGIERSVAEGVIPSPVRRAMAGIYERLRAGDRGALLVARSSAACEDSERASGAGQYHTELAIDCLEALEEGVRRVWASLFSKEAVSYFLSAPCAHPGSADQELPMMAVVIQSMVPASASGVAFSFDIRNSRPGIRVEAIEGLGERLVSGSETPDSWLFDPTGSILLEKTIASQGRKLIFDEKAGTLALQDIMPADRLRPSLSDQAACCVASAVHTISRAFPREIVDTEFAFDGQGELYMLQARPETTVEFGDVHNPVIRGLRLPEPTPPGLKVLFTGGETASPGAASGRIVVVCAMNARNPEQENMPLAYRHCQPGDLLVTVTTNIGWTPLLGKICGVVAERGGVMSHTAIVAREKDIPAVVGAWEFVARLKDGFGKDKGILQKENGDVWIFPTGCLDATNLRLCNRALEVVTGKLSDLLDPGAGQTPTDYYEKRTEFPHFVDDRGTDWTGKPEYPLSVLQYDLYFEAWRRAFDMLGLLDSDMPLMTSIAVPYPDGRIERRVGSIRPGSSEIREKGEYRVVAFPTEKLAALGDRIRTCGIPIFRGTVLDQILEYNEKRREAYCRVADLMAGIEENGDPFEVDFRKLFDAYSEAIGFAHMRAAFRRRVAGPLRAEAIRKLPDRVRGRIEKMLLLSSTGLFTETSHCRDIDYNRLLLRICRRPRLRDRLLAMNVEKALRFFASDCSNIYDLLIEHASNYKIERAQTDALENDLPLQGLMEKVQNDLKGNDSGPIHSLFTRTSQGYAYEVERLRDLVYAEDPDFDFDAFSKVMILSWEIPALTDNERHLQHRYQYRLHRMLGGVEEALRDAGMLGGTAAVSDLSRDEFLCLVENHRAGKPV